MVFELPLVLGLGTTTQDTCVDLVFGAPMLIVGASTGLSIVSSNALYVVLHT